MIRNIPNRYTQSELLVEIKEAGFDNKFDFFYLPMDHETHANFGYAFINFVEERDVDPFTKRFNGLKLNRFTSNKIIQIVPAQLQGFQANLQHYCKKAVCTDDNLDYRPLFFVDGKCLEFHRASDFTDAGLSPRAADAVASSIAQGKSGSRTQRGKGSHGSSARSNGGVFQRKSRE
jgi:RNA recognition motif-containing protein